MGIDYSESCGACVQRPRSSGLYSTLWDTWQHESSLQKQTSVLVSPEEAYMIRKQQTLNIHYIPCEKLKMRFEQTMARNSNQDLSHQEFCKLLVSQKLLRDDYPMEDERWANFYSKFIVVDENKAVGFVANEFDVGAKYALIPTIIAIIFLAQGNAENKAKAIGDLFSQHSFYQAGIANVEKEHYDITMRGRLEETMLSAQQLKCIISIFVNLALTLLPLYAADYPTNGKRGYYKLLTQWSKRSNQVVDHYITEFKGGQLGQSASGRISAM